MDRSGIRAVSSSTGSRGLQQTSNSAMNENLMATALKRADGDVQTLSKQLAVLKEYQRRNTAEATSLEAESNAVETAIDDALLAVGETNGAAIRRYPRTISSGRGHQRKSKKFHVEGGNRSASSHYYGYDDGHHQSHHRHPGGAASNTLSVVLSDAIDRNAEKRFRAAGGRGSGGRRTVGIQTETGYTTLVNRSAPPLPTHARNALTHVLRELLVLTMQDDIEVAKSWTSGTASSITARTFSVAENDAEVGSLVEMVVQCIVHLKTRVSDYMQQNRNLEEKLASSGIAPAPGRPFSSGGLNGSRVVTPHFDVIHKGLRERTAHPLSPDRRRNQQRGEGRLGGQDMSVNAAATYHHPNQSNEGSRHGGTLRVPSKPSTSTTQAQQHRDPYQCMTTTGLRSPTRSHRHEDASRPSLEDSSVAEQHLAEYSAHSTPERHTLRAHSRYNENLSETLQPKRSITPPPERMKSGTRDRTSTPPSSTKKRASSSRPKARLTSGSLPRPGSSSAVRNPPPTGASVSPTKLFVGTPTSLDDRSTAGRLSSAGSSPSRSVTLCVEPVVMTDNAEGAGLPQHDYRYDQPVTLTDERREYSPLPHPTSDQLVSPKTRQRLAKREEEERLQRPELKAYRHSPVVSYDVHPMAGVQRESIDRASSSALPATAGTTHSPTPLSHAHLQGHKEQLPGPAVDHHSSTLPYLLAADLLNHPPSPSPPYRPSSSEPQQPYSYYYQTPGGAQQSLASRSPPSVALTGSPPPSQSRQHTGSRSSLGSVSPPSRRHELVEATLTRQGKGGHHCPAGRVSSTTNSLNPSPPAGRFVVPMAMSDLVAGAGTGSAGPTPAFTPAATSSVSASAVPSPSAPDSLAASLGALSPSKEVDYWQIKQRLLSTTGS